MSSRDDAYAEFYAAARPRLRGTAYLLCGDWHRAADLAQEGLIRLYVVWPRLRRNGAEFAYARKAVVSAYLDANRRRSSQERPTERDWEQPSADNVAGDVVDRATIMTALARLPERQRAAVVLRYFEDLSVRDCAEILGCTEGTVKTHTSRGLDTLRSLLDDELTTSGERNSR